MNARDELAQIWADAYVQEVPVIDAILAAGYSKPRTITTAEELDALPAQTLVRAVKVRNPKFGDVFERFLSGWLHLDPSDREDGEGTVNSSEVLRWYGDLSVIVLWEPEA